MDRIVHDMWQRGKQAGRHDGRHSDFSTALRIRNHACPSAAMVRTTLPTTRNHRHRVNLGTPSRRMPSHLAPASASVLSRHRTAANPAVAGGTMAKLRAHLEGINSEASRLASIAFCTTQAARPSSALCHHGVARHHADTGTGQRLLHLRLLAQLRLVQPRLCHQHRPAPQRARGLL